MVSNMQAQADAYKVGGRIRDARKERGMNQERLAELVDCGLNTVSRIEVGQSNMPISSFFKFADALGVAPGELAPHRFRERDKKAVIDCGDMVLRCVSRMKACCLKARVQNEHGRPDDVINAARG